MFVEDSAGAKARIVIDRFFLVHTNVTTLFLTSLSMFSLPSLSQFFTHRERETVCFFTISVIIDCRFLGFRDKEEARLKTDPKLTLGDVTTINLTIMEGGVQVGIVSSSWV